MLFIRKYTYGIPIRVNCNKVISTSCICSCNMFKFKLLHAHIIIFLLNVAKEKLQTQRKYAYVILVQKTLSRHKITHNSFLIKS